MQKICLNELSNYRTALMGFATIWIVLVHFPFNIPIFIYFEKIGYMGVDIFMLLSGFGLFFSLQKPKFKILSFYKRRLSRILPTYFVAVTAFCLLRRDAFPDFLKILTTYGYWTGEYAFDWYVPSILLLYLLSPIVRNILKSNKLPIISFASIMVIIAFLFGMMYDGYKFTEFKFMFYSRIPVFILGFVYGYYTKRKAPEFLTQISIASIFAFAFYTLLCYTLGLENFNNRYLQNSFLAPFVIFVTLFALKYSSKLTSFLNYIGVRSLEIYLVHYCLLNVFQLHGIYKLIAVISTFLIAIVLHTAIVFIQNRVCRMNIN